MAKKGRMSTREKQVRRVARKAGGTAKRVALWTAGGLGAVWLLGVLLGGGF